MGKNGVDGVFTADPKTHKDAEFIEEITYQGMLEKDLQIMDATAVSLCKNSGIEIRVFNMNDTSNLTKILDGEKVGTTIKGE